MRMIAACLIFLSACSSPPKEKEKKKEKEKEVAPLPAELQVLRDRLTEAGNEIILYKLISPKFKGRVWTYENEVERPNPKIPHRTLSAEEAGQLADLVLEKNLKVESQKFASYSYILEFMKDGKPVARVDFHTVGFGYPTIMLISKGDKRLKDGAEQLRLTSGGRKAWLKTLGKIWKQ